MTIAEYLAQEACKKLEARHKLRLDKEREKARKEREKAQKEKERMILKLYDDGVDLDTIARWTETPISQLEQLVHPKAS